MDLAAEGLLDGLVERHLLDREHLVVFQALLGELEAGGEVQPDLLVGEAGGGPDPAEGLELAGAVAGLLLGFAGGAGLGRLAAVELAGRDLEEPAAGGVAVLAHQQHGAVFEQRHHGGGAPVMDQLHVHLLAIGQAHAVHVDVDRASAVDLAAAEPFALGPVALIAHLSMILAPVPRSWRIWKGPSPTVAASNARPRSSASCWRQAT